MAGFLFFNDEETETGGLIFSGANGETGGSLTFDAYEQDQIVQVLGTQDGSGHVAGLIVNDRPTDRSIAEDLQEFIDSDGSVENKPPGYYGTRRVFAGTEEGDATLNLCDGQGRPRLRLRVTADGEAAIDFIDEEGGVRQTLGPQGPALRRDRADSGDGGLT